MTNQTIIATRWPAVMQCASRVLHWLESIPYSLLAIPLRIGVAAVFWFSAMSHLASWDTTLQLFEEEYKVPILPTDVAANLAVAIEVVTPVLLVLGVLTRLSCLVLLGMTLVIEVFVYPLAWPTHVQWAAMLLVLLARGPGKVSLDWPIRRRLLGEA